MVCNLIDNRVFKRVCILLKNSGNEELVKELLKIRRIISINRKSLNNISDVDSAFASDFESFARCARSFSFNDHNLMSYFSTKVSYELKNTRKMLSVDYPMTRFMGGALEGSGNYTDSMKNLVDYMELINSSH